MAAIRFLQVWENELAEGNDLYHDMIESGVIDKTALVLGK